MIEFTTKYVLVHDKTLSHVCQESMRSVTKGYDCDCNIFHDEMHVHSVIPDKTAVGKGLSETTLSAFIKFSF